MKAYAQNHSFALRKLVVFTTIVFGLISLCFLSSCASIQTDNTDTIYYLVRHAEKDTTPDIGPDPELVETGKARAKTLANILADKGITHIHSSDFIRTKTTAAPLAAALGLDVQIYDAYDMPTTIAQIKQQAGRHLIVGHSNTTPEAVELLGGPTQPVINEEHEHDRLYTITVSKDGNVHTKLSRYGVHYVPNE